MTSFDMYVLALLEFINVVGKYYYRASSMIFFVRCSSLTEHTFGLMMNCIDIRQDIDMTSQYVNSSASVVRLVAGVATHQ